MRFCALFCRSAQLSSSNGSQKIVLHTGTFPSKDNRCGLQTFHKPQSCSKLYWKCICCVLDGNWHGSKLHRLILQVLSIELTTSGGLIGSIWCEERYFYAAIKQCWRTLQSGCFRCTYWTRCEEILLSGVCTSKGRDNAGYTALNFEMCREAAFRRTVSGRKVLLGCWVQFGP